MASSLASPTFLSVFRGTGARADLRSAVMALLDCTSLVGDHALDFGQVSLVHHRAHIHLALPLGLLGSQDMALESASALHFAGSCLLEALGGARVRLQFWHLYSVAAQQLGC